MFIRRYPLSINHSLISTDHYGDTTNLHGPAKVYSTADCPGNDVLWRTRSGFSPIVSLPIDDAATGTGNNDINRAHVLLSTQPAAGEETDGSSQPNCPGGGISQRHPMCLARVCAS